jgi:hypothetical protein
MVARIAATGKVGGPYWPYIASVLARACNSIQHFPLLTLADPEGGEWRH